MKNKLLKEYRTWFDIFKSQLIQNADRQKNATYPKIRQAILAEDAERYEQQLTGMLHLIRGLELLTEQEYEKLSKEVKNLTQRNYLTLDLIEGQRCMNADNK